MAALLSATPLLIAAGLLAACAQPAAPSYVERERLMARIEATVVMPPAAAPLASYARRYAYDRGSGEIVGLYSLSGAAGRQWVAAEAMNAAADGGCAFVDVRARADGTAVSAACHGEA